MSFNYENNLEHQSAAIAAALGVFENFTAKKSANVNAAAIANPSLDLESNSELFAQNVARVQRHFGLAQRGDKNKKIVDLSMETGTGKTYTYAKLMFELNKTFGMSKFVIVLPTLAIKAGVVSFLEASRGHFRAEFEREINLYVVESTKAHKKELLPQAVSEFVSKQIVAGREIEVLIINQGMLNSSALDREYERGLFDALSHPFSAIAALAPVVIIDEPHRFKQANKTFENIRKLGAQVIFRFGATFDGEEENLIYKLTPVQAFNNHLVKGVRIFVSEFEGANAGAAALKLINFNANEANFELFENGVRKNFAVGKKEAMTKIHTDLAGLWVENIGKIVALSNGLELKRGDVINPYSYNETLQEKMIKAAIDAHFELERKLFARSDKIKPLTLFFIDDIEGYRARDGALRVYFEKILRAKMQDLVRGEQDEFYKAYLEISLADISLTHGGYFSKDNSESDEKIEKEINEILHDKESLLSLQNPRRFIFSKWTLREGWDNPNVFGICKLRSSGSTTSKLQEVGRGLRLPVNEYGARVKSGEFFLNYFVDFTEKGFAASLAGEINAKSAATADSDKLNDELARKICDIYGLDNEKFFEDLSDVITLSHKFKENGLETLKKRYPLAFESLRAGKILGSGERARTAHIRAGKFDELRELWEKINQKAILQYNIKREDDFLSLLVGFLQENAGNFKPASLALKEYKMKFGGAGNADFETLESAQVEVLANSYMTYGEFLLALSSALKAKASTLHRAFCASGIDIGAYLSYESIRMIKQGFSKYLLDNSVAKFSIAYRGVKNSLNLRASAFTTPEGEPLAHIDAANLGVEHAPGVAVQSYMFDEIYYDSDLERENILSNIDTISVFTKIPKNSIKIPVSGGGSYSPDFAYVIKDKAARQTLHLIVEVKNKQSRDLTSDESRKIAHAQEFFKAIDESVKIVFKTQLQSQRIKELIHAALGEGA